MIDPGGVSGPILWVCFDLCLTVASLQQSIAWHVVLRWLLACHAHRRLFHIEGFLPMPCSLLGLLFSFEKAMRSKSLCCQMVVSERKTYLLSWVLCSGQEESSVESFTHFSETLYACKSGTIEDLMDGLCSRGRTLAHGAEAARQVYFEVP